MEQHWEKKALARQKDYDRLLKQIPIKDALKVQQNYHEEVVSKTDCLTCAQCCKNYSPRFKTPDIRRISKALRMKESAFIDQYLTLDEEGDYVVKSSPCPFLGADNHCRIYAERPSDCARFPYTDEDVLFKRKKLTLKNATFCPIVYQVLEKFLEK